MDEAPRSRLATPDEPYVNLALLVGRVLIVVGLIPNGLRKIATFTQTAAGMGGTPQVIAGRAFPDQTPLLAFPMPELFLSASILFDLLGALLIIIGWQTRKAGTVLAAYVLIAMAIYHSDIRHAADLMHLIRNLPFLAGLIVIGGVGAGHWSVDGQLARRRSGGAIT